MTILRIDPFNADIVRASPFDCGEPELNAWLARYAGQNERKGSPRTRLLLDVNECCVAGYVSTTAFQLEPAKGATAVGASGRYPISAVLIARLAIHRPYQGQGAGGLLLTATLESLADASKTVGFEIIVVHALHETAAGFYLRHGFRRSLDEPRTLYMTVTDLRAAFGSSNVQ
ncbi:GNAT family N-acetyltransferase [Sanguibacter massiliensis]|uniref:GNAT family N-acetyltransferase n=1 Tax=Sanguibacter massiliensis TaxID=1973217 RepID=UPI0013EC8AED|nr:GNAT family N-acetyltransferase [Sanguibacter massiliensis]